MLNLMNMCVCVCMCKYKYICVIIIQLINNNTIHSYTYGRRKGARTEAHAVSAPACNGLAV